MPKGVHSTSTFALTRMAYGYTDPLRDCERRVSSSCSNWGYKDRMQLQPIFGLNSDRLLTRSPSFSMPLREALSDTKSHALCLELGSDFALRIPRSPQLTGCVAWFQLSASKMMSCNFGMAKQPGVNEYQWIEDSYTLKLVMIPLQYWHWRCQCYTITKLQRIPCCSPIADCTNISTRGGAKVIGSVLLLPIRNGSMNVIKSIFHVNFKKSTFFPGSYLHMSVYRALLFHNRLVFQTIRLETVPWVNCNRSLVDLCCKTS